MEDVLTAAAIIIVAAGLIVIGTRLGSRYVDRKLTPGNEVVDLNKPIVIKSDFAGASARRRRPF